MYPRFRRHIFGGSNLESIMDNSNCHNNRQNFYNKMSGRISILCRIITAICKKIVT